MGYIYTKNSLKIFITNYNFIIKLKINNINIKNKFKLYKTRQAFRANVIDERDMTPPTPQPQIDVMITN